MIGKTNAGGGGGFAGLNFRVIGGTSAPKNPKENDIWVNTSGNVSGWAFSASEPVENVTDGFIWVCVHERSSVSFNALKKNAIEIRPSGVYEYTNNGWVERAAQIYKYGAWSDVKKLLYIYNNGKSTGYSWKCDTTMKQNSSGYDARPERVTINETDVTVTTNPRTYDFTNIFVTNSSDSFVNVDLSAYTKIRIKGTLAGAINDTACVFRVLSAMGDLATYNNVISKPLTSVTIDETIDISAVDSSCYIGFTFYNSTTNANVITFKISELWLE